eukprot:scaffold41_cov177-Alexandrium_tamarense.AAC.1
MRATALPLSILAIFCKLPTSHGFSPPSSTYATSTNSIRCNAALAGGRSHSIQQRRLPRSSIIMCDAKTVEEKEAEEEKKRIREKIFWAKQQALAAEMAAQADSVLFFQLFTEHTNHTQQQHHPLHTPRDNNRENKEKFAKRRLALTSDTLYFSLLISCLLWLFSSNPFVTISYLFGATSGTAYAYGLGKYVETIGGSIDDIEEEGAGAVGKFRDQGLLEIPSIMGFFTYQLASLGQGLREIDD